MIRKKENIYKTLFSALIVSFVCSSQAHALDVALETNNQRSYPSHYDRGVYFDIDALVAHKWRNCYTTTFEEAHLRIKNKDHKNLKYLEISNISTKNKIISFNVKYYSSNYSANLPQCVFDDKDVLRSVSCEVSLIGKHPVKNPSSNFDSWILYDKFWRSQKGEEASVIDCDNQKIKRISNSWLQSVSLENVKIMSTLAKAGIPLRTIGASDGGVKMGQSLHPYQNWSASLSLPFLRLVFTAEVCDASLNDMSSPGAVESQIKGLGGGWCPWGVEVSQLKCQGMELIENKSIEKQVDVIFDKHPELMKYCKELAQ